jgi:osmotically-inducible protein OsmY
MPRTGPHAGRGPRNYRRPDHRIHEELCERLTDDPWVDARDIEVEVAEARVVLRGAVPDRSMKHRAEDLADSVFGVADVENQIRVQRPGGSRGPRGDATPARAEDAAREGSERGEDRH